MGMRGARRALVLGLVGVGCGLAGCDERRDGEVREDARKAGRQLGDAARDVGETTREAVEGFKQGIQDSRDRPVRPETPPPPSPRSDASK